MESLYEEFMRGEREAPPEVRDRQLGATGTWHLICTCGHQERFHSTAIGGTAPEHEVDRLGIEHLVPGCYGEVWGRGREMVQTKVVEGRPQQVHVATCVCLKFKPVAEALDPRFRFRQRKPVIRAIGEVDRHYTRHAFRTGIRATMTMVTKLKRVANAQVTDRQRAQLVDREFNARFRWLPGARVCATPDCGRTEDVWPVYVAEDQSELRCAEHRERM